MTGAPLVADGVLITGISGAEFGVRAFPDGWDPDTGKKLWPWGDLLKPDDIEALRAYVGAGER